jgi:murein DD-endopeptidase MepM/ murein hydrolase activator NlpD
MGRYFAHLPPDGSPAIYWRRVGRFAGLPFHYNFNLLARALGDEPSASLPAWADLVPAQEYDFGEGTVRLQPFAFTPQGGNIHRPEAMPVTPNLNRFLNDPLLGECMDLSLPFYDEDMKLGPSGGGWFTKEVEDIAFHGGIDFNKRPRAVFDVCAAAEGKVAARDTENGKRGGAIVLSHFTPQGKEFRTIYQHIDMTSTHPSLKVGSNVRRGQFLGRTSDVSIIHLHFALAVQAPSLRLSGVQVPALWYFIDPSGVYDYYEHDTRTHSTYLPPESLANTFDTRIAGAAHTVHWQKQPLSETIPIARNTEGYKAIIRIQARLRQSDNFGGTLPNEQEQLLIWLKDEPEAYAVPLAESDRRTAERELATLLREAYFHGKPVQLEYRHDGDAKYVMAASIGGVQ